jgi:GT2 family glycosyltransferase/glycosyltransferase involved in cell wall biosynthesis
VDLCLAVRERGFKVVCCTSAFIYHYGQITEGRTADDDDNARYFAGKWGSKIRPDEDEYHRRDAIEIRKPTDGRAGPAGAHRPAFYFADDLRIGSALAWATADLALALRRLGIPVALKAGELTETLPEETRRELGQMMVTSPDLDGIHVKWSHYWPQHLSQELEGRINLELFVINYLFGQPRRQPWDYWLQCVAQNHYQKLPLSEFCKDVLAQAGIPETQTHVLPLGYSPEILDTEAPHRARNDFRFLTITNSHDLERYGTLLLLEAYWAALGPADDVVLVVKDYGAAAGDRRLRELIQGARGRARVEYIDEFTSKRELIRLYRACDAFVSAHRGEGFGMKLLDALACGLPVVTPLFGGPTDFCSPANSFPVDFRLVPVGDCLDRRNLALTNQPLWCEADGGSLASQLRRVFDDPAAARVLGDRGRRDVTDRFTWDNSARRLVEIVETIRTAERARSSGRPRRSPPAPVETSPYWLGLRITVVIPTHDRKDMLLKCLRALERQSILPQEFEVVIVDDGSTDGTAQALESQQFAFQVQFHRQTQQGPGAARNLAVAHAHGEIVLFIGDDIIADERLLENHLLAHARMPDCGTAVLGFVDWPPWIKPTSVMEYVCGEGAQQFAYKHIPHMPSLNWGAFYTSNISLKRKFLLEAAEAGIVFDGCFHYAAFEDAEFALRLTARGLRIQYCADAIAYHEHWMDVDSFAKREYNVGRMAVVFYRKHPKLDDVLGVQWLGDCVEAVETMVNQPALVEKIRAFDTRTDSLLVELARSIEELHEIRATVGGTGATVRAQDGSQPALQRVFGLIFDVARTRGKAAEWFANVEDPRKIEAAQMLAGCLRKLEFFAMDADPVAGLRARISELESQLGAHAPASGNGGRSVGVRSRMLLRTIDTTIQARLRGMNDPRWLGHYARWRGRLKTLLRHLV